jgi:hypothetical protein
MQVTGAMRAYFDERVRQHAREAGIADRAAFDPAGSASRTRVAEQLLAFLAARGTLSNADLDAAARETVGVVARAARRFGVNTSGIDDAADNSNLAQDVARQLELAKQRL